MKAYLDHEEGVHELSIGEVAPTEVEGVARMLRDASAIWLNESDESTDHAYTGYYLETRGDEWVVVYTVR